MQLDMDALTNAGAALECTTYRTFWTAMDQISDAWRYTDVDNNGAAFALAADWVIYGAFGFYTASGATATAVLCMLSKITDGAHDPVALDAAGKDYIALRLTDTGSAATLIVEECADGDVTNHIDITLTPSGTSWPSYRYRPLFFKMACIARVITVTVHRRPECSDSALFTGIVPNAIAVNTFDRFWAACSYHDEGIKTITGWSGHFYINEVPPSIFTESNNASPFKPDDWETDFTDFPTGHETWTAVSGKVFGAANTGETGNFGANYLAGMPWIAPITGIINEIWIKCRVTNGYAKVALYASAIKSGAANGDTLNHLIDTTLNQFVAGDVGSYVYNATAGTSAYVTAYVSASNLTLSADIFPAGTGNYVLIKPTGTPLAKQNTSTLCNAGIDTWNKIGLDADAAVTAGSWYWLFAANNITGVIRYATGTAYGESYAAITYSTFTFGTLPSLTSDPAGEVWLQAGYKPVRQGTAGNYYVGFRDGSYASCALSGTLKGGTSEISFRLNSLGAGRTIYPLELVGSGGSALALIVESGGHYYVRVSLATYGASTETVKEISLSTWYTMKLVYNNYTKVATVFLDGVYAASVTSNNATLPVITPTTLYIGDLSVATGASLDIRWVNCMNGTTYFPSVCRGGAGDTTLVWAAHVDGAHSAISTVYGTPCNIYYKVDGSSGFTYSTQIILALNHSWINGGIRWDSTHDNGDGTFGRWLFFILHWASGQTYSHSIVYFCTDAELKLGTLNLMDGSHQLINYWNYPAGSGNGQFVTTAGTTVLTDNTASWATDQFKGWKVRNITDSVEDWILSNTTTTITTTNSLTWTINDHYHIILPASVYASRGLAADGTLMVGLEYGDNNLLSTTNYLETVRVNLLTGLLTYRALFAHYDEGLGANYVIVAEPMVWFDSNGHLCASVRCCKLDGTYNQFRFRRSTDLGVTDFDGTPLLNFGNNWEGHNAIPRFLVFGNNLWSQTRVNLPQGSTNVCQWYTSVRKVDRLDGDVCAEYWWESLGEGGNGDDDSIETPQGIYFIDYASDFWGCAQYVRLSTDFTMDARPLFFGAM